MFSWGNFLTYAIITAVTPGQNTIMSLSNAGRVGFRRNLPFSFGIMSGVSIIMILSTFFANLLSTAVPKIKTPMIIIGAIYMLYLAWNIYKSEGIEESKGTYTGFWRGFFLQFVNPKLYLYAIISIEVYILPYYRGQILPLLGFSFILTFIGFLSVLSWAAFGSIFKILFSKYTKITNTIMALLLVYCAISLFL